MLCWGPPCQLMRRQQHGLLLQGSCENALLLETCRMGLGCGGVRCSRACDTNRQRCGSLLEQVFINQKFIGGGDDTVKLKSSGELQKMLTAQPAAA